MGLIYDKLYSKYNKSVLSKSEVATEFGISVRTIERRTKQGKMAKPLNSADDKRYEWSLIDIAIFLGDKDQ